MDGGERGRVPLKDHSRWASFSSFSLNLTEDRFVFVGSVCV